MKKKLWLGVITFLLVTAIALFAVGQKEEVIKIGAPIPLTGPFASDGEEMRKAIELGIHEVNEAGGLFGKKLKLFVGDVGALEAEKIQAVGERLLGEKVDMIITGYNDGGTDVYIFGGKKIPYLHSNVNSLCTKPVAENPEFRNCFQYWPNEFEYGIDAAEILWDIAANTGWVPPNNKVATVKVDYSYNIVAANKFNEQAKQKGFEIVVDELHQFGVVEWGPIISKIEQTQPAFITFWNCDVMDASRFMIQLRDYLKDSFNALVYMQFTPCTPEFKELTGEAANGLVWSTGGILKDTSEYDARFENLHGGPPQGMYAYWTYDAFQIWLEAVKKVGDPFDYDAVCQAIRKTDYRGYIGRVVFREEDQSAIRGDEYIPLFWYQIWDGKDVAILPEKSKEGEFRLPPWIPQ